MLRSALLALVLLAPAPALAEERCEQDHPFAPFLEMWRSPAPAAGRIGIEIQALTPQLRDHFKVEGDGGVLVAGVVPGSPAEKAGLRAGDVILEADGQALGGPRDLRRLVSGFPEDRDLGLEISRDGQRERLELRPGPRPESPLGASLAPWMPGHQELEERLRELEERVRALEEGR